MARATETLADRLTHRRALRRWSRLAQTAMTIDIGEMRNAQARAQQLREPLNRLCQVADLRLTRPRIGAQAIADKPLGTDWSWRPEAWAHPLWPEGQARLANKSTVGKEITVFHDCPLQEIGLRQFRNKDDSDLAPFSVQLEAFGFDGSFFSLAVDLPNAASQNISASHVFTVTALSEIEAESALYARLNIRNGPNTEQMISEMRLVPSNKAGEAIAEFDLAYATFNPARVEKIWVDLIVEKLAMNRIRLRDLTVTRHQRANL